MIDALVQNGCTEVSVYGGRTIRTMFFVVLVFLLLVRWMGLFIVKKKSITTKGDYSKYALVKTFALIGKTKK